jgi:hypothetical protein
MLYRLLKHPFTPGIRLLKRQPDRKYHPSWWVVGQDKDMYFSLVLNIPGDTVGLFLHDAGVYQFFEERAHPAKALLIDEQVCYVQTKFLVEVTDVLQGDTETNSPGNSTLTQEPG